MKGQASVLREILLKREKENQACGRLEIGQKLVESHAQCVRVGSYGYSNMPEEDKQKLREYHKANQSFCIYYKR